MRSWLTALFACWTSFASAEELRQSFGTADYKDAFFAYDMASKQYIFAEANGIHWLFPEEKKHWVQLGINWKYHAHGNFIVTVGYNFRPPKRDSDSNGVGFALVLTIGELLQEKISFKRSLLPGGQPNLELWHRTVNPKNQVKNKVDNIYPTSRASDAGRLRLERQENTLIASIAEGNKQEFREIDQIEIGTGDVLETRFAPYPIGAGHADLDLYLKEFNFEADRLIPIQSLPPRTGPKRTWYFEIFTVVVLAAALILGIRRWKRRF